MLKFSSTVHHHNQLRSLDSDIHKMCLCKNCVSFNYLYYIYENFDKCVKCIHLKKICDLSSLNTAKYCCLNKKC